MTAFASDFTEITLAYTPPGTGEIVTDEAGNETRAPGPVKTVRCFLKAPRRPDVTAQIGADAVRVDYEGRLTSPASPPTDFTTGTRVTFQMDGREQLGRVYVYPPSPIAEVESEMGRRLAVSVSG